MSLTFELVRAVRIDGKPRQQFLLSLGSLRYQRGSKLVWFWVHAIILMRRGGLDLHQRRNLGDQIHRKGAPLPTAAECDEFDDAARRLHCEGPLEELRALTSASACRLMLSSAHFK